MSANRSPQARHGFGGRLSRPALAKAAAWNIRCLGLSEIEQFDWCQATTIEYGERNLIFQQPWGVATASPVDALPDFRGSDGRPLTADQMSRLAHGYLAMRHIELAAAQDNEARVHPVTAVIRHQMPPDLFVMTKQGVLIPITLLEAHVTYQMSSQIVPLEFHEYRDEATGKLITGAAIAKLDGAAGSADFVLKRGDAGALTMTLIPRGPDKQ